MAATTFLTGRPPAPAPEAPPLAATPTLSIADGLRLLQTPSSEAGVLAYHRALEGGPPAPQVLLAELAALRDGQATRFELLGLIATSPKARERGVGGPGLLLIRLVRKAFLVSGAAGRVKARRAMAAQAERAALASPDLPSTPADVARKLVVMEGALLRLEAQLFTQARASQGPAAFAALEARVAALEAELKLRLADPAPRP